MTKGHRHADFHKKRDVIVTDYATVYTTAPAAVVYVDDQGHVLYTSTQTPNAQVQAASVEENATPTAIDYPSPAPTTLVTTSKAPAPAKPSSTPDLVMVSQVVPTYQAPTYQAPPPAETSLAGGAGGYIGGGNPSSNTHGTGNSNGAGRGGAGTGSGSSDSGSDGYGISYAPYNADGTCKTQAQVNSDFEQISDFSIVRSYGVDCNQVSTILSAAKAKNMKVLLGVFNIQPASQLAADISTLVSAVGGDWSSVHSVSIGNEDVNQGKAQPADVVAATNSGRSQLRAAGFSGPVVHVDTFNQIIAHPEMCEASDYAAANCHAFFDPNTSADNAGAFVAKQAAAIKSACGGKEVYITESGWPHGGDANGLAVPSPQNQQTALAGLKSSFKSNLFLFSAFDDLWKQNNAGTYGAEQYWGFLS